MPGPQDFRSLLNRQRWLECENTGGQEIPAYGMIEITGATNPDPGRIVLQVQRPTLDGQGNLAVNSHVSIAVGDLGACTIDFPTWAKFTEESPSVDPAVTESWGVVTDDFTLRRISTNAEIGDNAMNHDFRPLGLAIADRAYVDRGFTRQAGGMYTDDETQQFPKGSVPAGGEPIHYDVAMNGGVGVEVTLSGGIDSRLTIKIPGNYFVVAHATVHNVSAAPPVEQEIIMVLLLNESELNSNSHAHMTVPAVTAADGVISLVWLGAFEVDDDLQIGIAGDDDFNVEFSQFIAIKV